MTVSWLTSCLSSRANGERHFEDFSFCHGKAFLPLSGPEASTHLLSHSDLLSLGMPHRGQFCGCG